MASRGSGIEGRLPGRGYLGHGSEFALRSYAHQRRCGGAGIRNAIKSLRVTETHPKVLYFALTKSVYDYAERPVQMVQDLVRRIALGPCSVGSEHAWDALVSAFAARQWDTGIWPNDLHQLPPDDGETLIPAHGSEAHYAWPEALPRE